jgi:hypothetical protein
MGAGIILLFASFHQLGYCNRRHNTERLMGDASRWLSALRALFHPEQMGCHSSFDCITKRSSYLTQGAQQWWLDTKAMQKAVDSIQAAGRTSLVVRRAVVLLARLQELVPSFLQLLLKLLQLLLKLVYALHRAGTTLVSSMPKRGALALISLAT